MKPGDIAFKVWYSDYFLYLNVYLLLKSNFGTYDEPTNMVITRRADRVMDVEGPIFCSLINGMFVFFFSIFQLNLVLIFKFLFLNFRKLEHFPDVEVSCKYLTEHRCAVRIRGKGLSGNITGTDPLVN